MKRAVAFIHASNILYNLKNSFSVSLVETKDGCEIVVKEHKTGQSLTIRDETSAMWFCRGLVWGK
jgi:hypothetical protein